MVAEVCGSRDAESHVETYWRLRLAAVDPGYFFIAWCMPDCCLCNIKKNALELERFTLRPANSVLMLRAGDRQKSLSLVDTQVSSAPNFGSNATSVVRYCYTNPNRAPNSSGPDYSEVRCGGLAHSKGDGPTFSNEPASLF